MTCAARARLWASVTALALVGCDASEDVVPDDAAVDGGAGDGGGTEVPPWWIREDSGTDASGAVADSGRVTFVSDDDGGADSDGGSDGATGVSYGGGDGSSCDEAVIILGAESTFAGILAEYAWLDAHYPGYTLLGQALSTCGSRHVDVLHIRTATGTEVDVYFDIEDFFGT